MMRRTVRGTVTQRRYAIGSKSEHDAVMIVTDDGEYRLSRKDGNPFHDPTLVKLIGKRVQAEGVITGPSFIVDGEISELA